MACRKDTVVGARAYVAYKEERCFGFYDGYPNDLNTADGFRTWGNWKLLEITSEAIINEIAVVESATLRPERARSKRRITTGIVGGDISAELSNDGFVWMIVNAIGRIIPAGAVCSDSPYTILPIDDDGVSSDCTAIAFQNTDSSQYASDAFAQYDDSSAAGYRSGYYDVNPFAREPGMTFLIGRDPGVLADKNGNAPSGDDKNYFRYTGMMVNTWEVTANPTDIVTTTFGMQGRLEEFDILMETPPNVMEGTNDPLAGIDGAITIDEESVCVTNFTMTVNNNIATDRLCLGQTNVNSLPDGQRQIEGTVTIELENTMFYNKFTTGDPAVIDVIFVLAEDAGESLRIILPDVRFSGTTPTSTDQGPISQELPFTALRSTTAATINLLKNQTAKDLLNNVASGNGGYDIAVEVVTATDIGIA